MKLRNIKAHVNSDKEIDIDGVRKIFKDCNATFTIHSPHKNVVHVTGVKSNTHLKLCIQYIENNFKVKVIKSIIDNQFFSHKDNKLIDLKKYIYEQWRESHILFFEPELSPSMVLKQKTKLYTCLKLKAIFICLSFMLTIMNKCVEIIRKKSYICIISKTYIKSH